MEARLDIVERLRSPRPDAHPSAGAAEMAEIDNQRREAADEIERLRDEIDTWKAVFPDVAPERVQPDRSRLEGEIDRLRAALRAIVTAPDGFENTMRQVAREALGE